MKALMIVVLLMFAGNAYAESSDGDEVVSVPKKYVSSEGLTHITSAPEKWIGIGREIGIATKEGLDAVVDSADKFGSTKVGTFVMVMIAWKVLAQDVLHVVLGIPVGIAGVFLWLYIARRLFFGYTMLDRKEGRTKFYKRVEPLNFNSQDARALAGLASTIGLAVWLFVTMLTIFV